MPNTTGVHRVGFHRQRLQASLEQMAVLQRQVNAMTSEVNHARLRETELRRVTQQAEADRHGAESERHLWAQERAALKQEIRDLQQQLHEVRSTAVCTC